MENMDSPQHISYTKKELQNVFDETKTVFDPLLSPRSIQNDGAPCQTSVNPSGKEASHVDNTLSHIPGIDQKAKCMSFITSQPSSPGEVNNKGSRKCRKERILLIDDLPRQTREISQINQRGRQRHGQMFQESRSSAVSQVCAEQKTGARSEYLDDLKNEIEKLAKMQKKLLKKQKKALRTLKKINSANSA
jgi:hypothetical protein